MRSTSSCLGAIAVLLLAASCCVQPGIRHPSRARADLRAHPPASSPSRVESSPNTANAEARGIVRVRDGVLVDDGGPFWAIGATYMAAAWFYKHDRARLERSLELLSTNGIGYIRVLGEVGGKFWSERETDPRWPDYDETIAGLTDLAFDRYGLRVQWTLFGGLPVSTTPKARRALVDRFAAIVAQRPEKIMLLEIANEGWKNGFEGARGRAELHALTARLKDRLRNRGVPVPVAPTSPEGTDCASWLGMYKGSVAEVATIHFARDVSGADGPWLPVILPWDYRECDGMPPVAVNNEPIGPLSSSDGEEDPTRLATAAAVSIISKLPLYTFHSRAGVRGDMAFEELPNVRETLRAFAALGTSLPPAAATGRPFDLETPGESLQLVSPPWTAKGSEGVLAGYGTVLGDDVYAVIAGIRGAAHVRAGRAFHVDVIDVLTGAVTERLDPDADDIIAMSGREAALLHATPR